MAKKRKVEKRLRKVEKRVAKLWRTRPSPRQPLH